MHEQVWFVSALERGSLDALCAVVITHCSGVQLLSNGLDKLHLQSVHLNGWHIGDECMALLRRAHAQSLYHLHLFDAGVTNKGLAELARLDSLETLLLDQCGQLDDEGIDQLVQESKLAIAEAEAAQIELAERRSRGDLFVASPSPSSSDNEDGPAQHPVAAAASRTVSLAHLELNSCARVTLNGLASLALHPTLRSLSVSGRALFGVPEGGAGGVGVGVGLAPSSAAAYQHERNIEAALAQIEQLSDARIVVNGGKRARRKAARKRRCVPARLTGRDTRVPGEVSSLTPGFFDFCSHCSPVQPQRPFQQLLRAVIMTAPPSHHFPLHFLSYLRRPGRNPHARTASGASTFPKSLCCFILMLSSSSLRLASNFLTHIQFLIQNGTTSAATAAPAAAGAAAAIAAEAAGNGRAAATDARCWYRSRRS
jgi:hypothetical protein